MAKSKYLFAFFKKHRGNTRGVQKSAKLAQKESHFGIFYLEYFHRAAKLCSPRNSCFFGEIGTQSLQIALVRPWADCRSAKMLKDAWKVTIFQFVPRYRFFEGFRSFGVN